MKKLREFENVDLVERFIYLVIYPKTNHVVYVGISWNVNSRIKSHLVSHGKPITDWINAVLNIGETVDIKVINSIAGNKPARDLENKYIAFYKGLNQAQFNKVDNWQMKNKYWPV